jgi:hypothetical protein
MTDVEKVDPLSYWTMVHNLNGHRLHELTMVHNLNDHRLHELQVIMPQFAVFSPTGTESNIDINPYSQDTVIEI